MVIVFTFHNYFYLKNLKLLNDEKLIGCNTYKYITYQGFIKILKFKQTLPYNFEFWILNQKRPMPSQGICLFSLSPFIMLWQTI